MLHRKHSIDPLRIFETESADGDGVQRWMITHTPPHPAWSSYQGRLPMCLDAGSATSGYWIMRCPRPIIKNHGDIWNARARLAYTRLFALAQALRSRAPAPYMPSKPAGDSS